MTKFTIVFEGGSWDVEASNENDAILDFRRSGRFFSDVKILGITRWFTG